MVSREGFPAILKTDLATMNAKPSAYTVARMDMAAIKRFSLAECRKELDLRRDHNLKDVQLNPSLAL